jgi:sigma-E factor negative regulatory protein RseA
MKEQLSAFIDNELSEFEERRLLAELERDPALRESWDRYHLIRAALRNELDLSAGNQATASRVSDGIADRGTEKPSLHWARPTARMAGTVAIAASVAAVTLVGLYTFKRPAGESAQLAAGAKPAANAVPVAAARWNTGKPELDRALNAYLAGHNEVAGGTGVGGVLPYVRVVDQEAARPADVPK